MQLSRKINRRTLVTAGVGALVALSGGALALLNRKKSPEGATVVNAQRIQGELPLTDPESSLWSQAKAFRIEVQPQRMVLPFLKQATIPSFTVRALFNGQQVGFLLEWGDETASQLESITNFRDAVAVMLPQNPDVEQPPPIFMGWGGKPVYILQWKASWQKDMEEGFQGVEKAYPNWFSDVYPEHPTMVELGMTEETARSFYPGLVAGNPLSQRKRTTPVEELVAEGYGSLTTLPHHRAQGKGVFGKGWKVSLGVPAPGEDVPPLAEGKTVPVAFALWDGGNQQRGGRKHYTPNWIELTL